MEPFLVFCFRVKKGCSFDDIYKDEIETPWNLGYFIFCFRVKKVAVSKISSGEI